LGTLFDVVNSELNTRRGILTLCSEISAIRYTVQQSILSVMNEHQDKCGMKNLKERVARL